MKRGISTKRFSMIFAATLALSLVMIKFARSFQQDFIVQAAEQESQSQQLNAEKPEIVVELDSDHQSLNEGLNGTQQETGKQKSAPIIVKFPKSDQSVTLLTLLVSIIIGVSIVFGATSVKRKYFSKNE